MSTKAGYAVIGSDGLRLVIWGVGDDETLARQDAANWLEYDNMEADLAHTETVAITAEQRETCEDTANVDPVALGILTRDDAARIGRRFRA